MATTPSAEDSARKILSIFKAHHRRAGEVIVAGALQRALAADPRYLQAGMAFAVEKGWVENLGNSFRLTEAGFAQM